tara:strand:+ start:1305 stop:2402 length:1098 start_codon:yes stop_codon:yes gene_type:complete
MPAVSVLMTVYNGEEFVAQTIDSILSQTFGDFEFVIVDNASTDDSLKIVESFDDSRIRLVRNVENLGQTKSLNIGLHQSCGKYIARIDADDLAFRQRLAMQVLFLDAHPEVAVVGSHVHLIDSDGQYLYTQLFPVESQDVLWMSLFTTPLAHSAVVMRRDVVCEVGGYDENLIRAQDYALWSKLINNGHLVTNLSEPLVSIRVHNDRNWTKSNIGNAGVEASVVMRHNIKTRVGMDISPEDGESMYWLVGHFEGAWRSDEDLSRHQILATLRVLHSIAHAFRIQVNRQSFFYIRMLIRIGLFRARVPFFTRVAIVVKALYLMCSPETVPSVVVFVRDRCSRARLFDLIRLVAMTRSVRRSGPATK